MQLRVTSGFTAPFLWMVTLHYSVPCPPSERTSHRSKGRISIICVRKVSLRLATE